jgi:Family of unknown function (DUF5335)
MEDAMVTVEVPRQDWARTLAAFTAVHDRWLVSVDLLDPDIGTQPVIRNLPLLEISADRSVQDGAIAISAASSPTDHVTHIVRAVKRLSIERTEDGADVALELQSTDGTATILTFRTVAMPETVDGVARFTG